MPAEQQLLELIAAHQQGILAAVTRNGYPQPDGAAAVPERNSVLPVTARSGTAASGVTRYVFRAGGVAMATPPAWLSQARR
jgi:hypothetical protein